jgi:hypothetical protein
MAASAPPKRSRIRTAVFAVYFTFAAAFVILSTTSIMQGVFGSALEGHTLPLPTDCTLGIRALTRRLELARVRFGSGESEDSAVASFQKDAFDDWSRTEVACKASERGLEAFAAVVRLRKASERAVRRQAAELGPLRRDVDAYLGPPDRPLP